MSCLLICTLMISGQTVKANPEQRELEVLRAAKIETETPALLAYFKSRTLTAADREQVAQDIKSLASRSFAARQKAFDGLKKRGVSVIPLLSPHLNDMDLEVRRRIEQCIAEIERGPGPEVPAAAARLLALRKAPDALEILLGFMPHAEDGGVEEAVLEALLALSPKAEKASAKLLAARTDELGAKRAAAAYVLGRRDEPALRADVKKMLADKNVNVRFRAAQALLSVKEPESVPALIALLTDVPLDIAWQIEETLYRLAENNAPNLTVRADDAGGREKCRDAWNEWWKKHGAKADLARARDVQRLLGLTLGIEYNTNKVWECNADGSLRWEITNVNGPMEAWVLPNNRVLIADGGSVTERDFKGTIVRTVANNQGGATGAQRLRNGNTFVSTYSNVMEFDKDGKKLYDHNIGGSNAIRKHANGNIIYATDTQIVEIDTAGNRVRSINIPKQSMYVGIEDIGPDRFMLANSNTGQVLEVNAAGKILWEANVAGACGVTRLPNGNTLVATSGKVVELNRTGKVVWERTTQGYVRRVHRR